MKHIRLLFGLLVTIMCGESREQSRSFIEPYYFFPTYTQCDCGTANDDRLTYNNYARIIGGTKAGFHEYPWLVQLQYMNTTICGGSIISDSFVLSAAHCFTKGLEQMQLKVVVGQHDMCTNNNDIVILSVTTLIRHEDFNPETFYADIMLLRLSMKLSFSKLISPICLPKPKIKFNVQQLYFGREATITGWGLTNQNGTLLSCVPKKLHIPILPERQCKASASTLFCAGFLEGGRDSCSGDSGGPVQIKNEHGKYKLIGVVSSGVGCALPKHPGEYTDVTIFIPWILNHVRGTKWCW